VTEVLGELLSPSQGKHIYDLPRQVVLPLSDWLERTDKGRTGTSRWKIAQRCQFLPRRQSGCVALLRNDLAVMVCTRRLPMAGCGTPVVARLCGARMYVRSARGSIPAATTTCSGCAVQASKLPSYGRPN
jgi:hypothetical protein